MNTRVRLSAWAAARSELSSPAVILVPWPLHTERAAWPAKPRASSLTPTNSSTAAAWRAPLRPRRPSPSTPASASAAPAPPAPPTKPSRPIWAATPTPSRSGAGASASTAWTACTTSRAAAARPLFPPADKHKVLVLATTPPAAVGGPTSHGSLDDLAFPILKDAHYRDMSRRTIQRVLAEADLQPHRCRYWLKSHDPDFAAKALDSWGLYLRALSL
jgi:hypothetical protein